MQRPPANIEGFQVVRRLSLSNKTTRFVLIGGFLGAGKTTLIGKIAQQYASAGKRVGIVTNDQAADLVDTHNLRSQGFEVGEVAGACFCCSFNDLVSTAENLGGDEAPDILLAEPVGSCTDLVATVVLPMQQMLGERFELSPFGVLLKPSHGKKILQAGSANQLSGFSPQAEYIFRKQLEEADYLMIGRADQLSEDEIAALTSALNGVAPDIPVIPVSPKTGTGIDNVMGYIESPMTAGRRLLEIDYDVYAEGEAELGWVNLTANAQTHESASLDQIVVDLVRSIADSIEESNGQIAHLKASVHSDDSQAVASIVSNQQTDVDVGLMSGRDVDGDLQIIVNARVAIDPEILCRICESNVRGITSKYDCQIATLNAHSLRPGRPTPTHRVSHE